MQQNNTKISNGVMLNVYPDSIGEKFSDTITMLKMTEFKEVFSLIYVLPTFFNSDLDRGFSIIDYDINKDLVDTQNLNADFKYEFFSDKKDMFAVGVYAKNIKDPIERIYEASASLLTTYKNSKVANLYGAEFEFILNMANLSSSLENVSLGFNTSLMKTQVEIANNNQLENSRKRELQGASSWVINADAKYEFNINQKIKNTVTLVYGVKGKNIYSVGTAGLDHIYELPFHKLDLVLSSKLTKNLNAKFSADNILNPVQKLVHPMNSILFFHLRYSYNLSLLNRYW